MTIDQERSGQLMSKANRRRLARLLAARKRRKWWQQYEILEQRTLLSGDLPTASINSVSIVLDPPGPTNVSGSLDPGNTFNYYQIDGTAGERLHFHNVSTTSSNGNWLLFGEAGNEIAGTGIASDFTANLSATGTYYLELIGNITAPINYSFQVSDTSDQPVATTGLGIPESGSLAAGTSTSFTFTAPAGLPVYFNSLDRSNGPVSATLTDPANHSIFSNNGSDNEGPFVLASSGTYSITLNNSSGSAGTYSFDMLSLPDAATSLALGPTQTIAGSLSSGTNTLVYSFQGASGEHIFVDNEQNLGDPVNYRLIGPDGGQIFNINSYSDSNPLTLSESGTYYLLVDGESASPINYQFRLTDTAYAPLSFDTPVTGSLSPAPATDVYLFAGTAGEKLTFASFNDSNGFYGASWALYGPNNQLLANPYYTDSFTETLPSDGDYTLVVPNNASSIPSTYSFEVYQNVNPTAPITFGTPVISSLANPGDLATYTFTGTAGQTLYFSSNNSAPGFYAQITDPGGSSILNQYLGYNYYTYEDSSVLTLPESGTYTVTISNQNETAGDFNFLLDDTAASTPVALNSGSGTSVADSIATGLSANIYRLTGSAGEHLYFQAQTQSASSSDLYWTLYGPANQYVTSSVYWYDFSTTLPATGTYYLVVGGTNPANTSGVTYNFEVFDNVDPSTQLMFGSEISGTISNPGDEATYTFTGTVGQTLLYHTLNDSYNSLYLTLTTPQDGNNILDQNTSASTSPFLLPFSGTYNLTIFGSGAATGGYDFVLDDTSSAPSISLTPGNGTTKSDSIPGGLFANVYQIPGTAGELLYLEALSESTGDQYDLEWTLYGPNGQQVSSSYYWNSFNATLPSAGTCYLVVQGNNSSNTTGLSYSFAVYDNVDPTQKLSLGVPISGTIDNPGDGAQYAFNGTAGQTLYFAGFDTTEVADVQLLDPSGEDIFNSSTDQGGGHFPLTETGTYTLAVTGAGNATGPYGFELENDSLAPFITLSPGSGTPVSDAISTGVSTNLYQITGSPGEMLYFQALAESGGPNDLAWTLWEPGGGSIGSGNSWSGFSATLPVTGTYLLAVNGTNPSNTSGVNYNFEIFDDLTTMSSFSLGDQVTGSIKYPGATTTYTFAGTVGQSVLLTVLGADAGIDAYVDDPAGSEILFGLVDEGPVLLRTTGTYSFTVFGDSGAIGNYSFVLTDVSTGTMLSPTATPGTESGTITPGTGYAIYQLSGTAGETLTLTSDSFSSTSGTWFLADPSDNQIESASFGTNFTLALPVSGIYTLALQGSDATDSSVTYSFDISATMPAPVTESGLPLAQSGSLDAGDSISFTFNAPAGLPLYFNSLDRSYGPITVTLTDPDNNTIFSDDNPSYNEGPFVLAVPGTYTLTLTSTDSSGSDPYSFVLESLADASTSTTIGSVTSGNLDPGLTTAVYSFTGTLGQTLYLDNQQNAGDPIYLSLYDPAFNQLLSIYSYGDGGPITLASSGTYYLLVDGESTGGPIDFQFRLTDPSANPLAENTVTSGTLSPPSAADSYSFSGTAGEMVTFHFVSESNGSNGASFTLYGPNNNYIGSSYYYYYSDSDFTTTLPVTGNYTLIVTNRYYYGSSTYSFEVYDNLDSTAMLTLGTPASGTLANSGDRDSYTFTGSAGQTVYLDNLGSDPGTEAQLTGPFGDDVFNQYIGYTGNTQNSRPYTLPDSGTYTLSFYNEYGEAGGYNAILGDASTAKTISLSSGTGTSVSDSLATGLSSNLYQFSGTSGELVYFQAQTQSAGTYDLYWTLYGPDNREVGSAYYWNNFSETLPTTGAYYLLVNGINPSNTSGVSFNFTVYENVDPTSSLALNTPVMGTLTNPGDLATYTFHGSAGQTLFFNGQSSVQGTYAELIGPSGNELFDQYIGYNYYVYSNYGPFTLSQPGTYNLIISNGDGDTGAFNFSLDDTSTATAITVAPGPGTPVTGAIATGFAVSFYQFSGTAGEQTYIQPQTQSAGTYDLYWILFGPDNQQITGNYFVSGLTATLPGDGTYRLVVEGTNGSNTSGVNFTFTVHDTANPTSNLPLNTQVTGTISNPGDHATYTFTGAAGQILYFNALASAAGSDAQLFGPGGNQIFNQQYGNDGPFTLSVPGTYTLILSNSNGATGSVSFDLEDAAAATTLALTQGSGTPRSDAISAGLSANIYQFSGTSGERVYFQGQTESAGFYDLYWTLYGPDNQYITANYFLSNLAATLPWNGTYRLVVDGTNSSNTSGLNYSFTAYDNVEPTSALPLNATVTGTIANPGDIATYTFTGSPGQLIEFNGLQPASYLLATLDDPEGGQVINQYMQSNAGPYLLSMAGTYTLTVSDTSSTPTGPYRFELMSLSSQPTIQVNTTEADLTVTLSQPSTEQILVPYSSQDDTATVADGDYKPASGVILFEPGQTTATVALEAIDRLAPTTTDFLVNLSNPVGATIATGQGTGTVTIQANGSGTVTGEVFDDVSGDGTLTTGDTGIAGVTVELLNTSNAVIASAVSGTGGIFTISSIPGGTYTVVEVTPTGYALTTPASGNYPETISTGETISGLNFGNFQTVTLTGEVFNDANGNGTLDSGEPGLSGWTVDLVNAASQVVAATTASGGNYSFHQVGPGTYSVKVVGQNGWVPTTLASLSVTTASGTNVSYLDFGEFQTVTYSGAVYSDTTGTGVFSSSDPGLSGWTVNLVNSANQLVATTTATNGGYSFAGVGPGTYTVAVVQKTGYVATTATSFPLVAQSGTNVSSLNFGEFGLVTFSGKVFNDASGSGVLGSGDTGLAGWTVDLVNSANQVTSTTTASDGSYSFANVGPGTYTIKVVQQTGYDATSPTSLAVTADSATNLTSENFGEFIPVTFSGEVYQDTNGLALTLTHNQNFESSSAWFDTPVSTGSFTAMFTYTDQTGGGADGIAFVLQNDSRGTTALGGNGSGLGYAGITPSAAYEINIYSGHTQGANYATDGSTGNYASTGSVVVQSGDPIDVALTYDATAGTLTAVLTDRVTHATDTQTFSDINLATQVGGQTAYVGFTGADGGASSIQTISGLTFTPSLGTSVTGFGVNGSGWSLNGVASLSTQAPSMLNPGDPGLANWTVNLVNSANQFIATTTAIDGSYSFSNVVPGTYSVEVVQQPGYVASSSTTIQVSAQSGTDVENLNFGEFISVSLSGEVFSDTDGNGVLNGSETGLAGWTVNLVNSANATVATATTGPDGSYSFTGVGPDEYTIQVVQKSGYVQSTPTVLVGVSSSQSVTNLNVGEFQTVTISGQVFGDQNGDGSLDGSDQGISGWTVDLVNSANQVVSTTTGSNGSFSFTGVGPGTFTVEDVLPSGYIQTTSPPSFSVTTISNQAVAGLSFGVFQLATASGELWNDANKDGALDNGESGLSGWTVNLVNSSGHVVSSTTTDSNGDYSLSSVPPGTYTIEEALQAGYIQTAPSSGFDTVTSSSGGVYPNQNIGVYKAVSLAVGGLMTVPSSWSPVQRKPGRRVDRHQHRHGHGERIVLRPDRDHQHHHGQGARRRASSTTMPQPRATWPQARPHSSSFRLRFLTAAPASARSSSPSLPISTRTSPPARASRTGRPP